MFARMPFLAKAKKTVKRHFTMVSIGDDLLVTGPYASIPRNSADSCGTCTLVKCAIGLLSEVTLLIRDGRVFRAG